MVKRIILLPVIILCIGMSLNGIAFAGTVNLPQTGQTQSVYEGDDGALRMGVAWPNPRFLDHGDGTVTDELTGLMWPKNANLPGTWKTWQEALNYVAMMNSGSGTYGFTDWRLPNVIELRSLISYGEMFPPKIIFPRPFTGIKVDHSSVVSYYWTSTTEASWPDVMAWVVDMTDADVETDRKTHGNYVWPVRSGTGGSCADSVVCLPQTGQTVSYDANTPQRDDGALRMGVAWPSPRFIDHGNGTFTDNLTGLMWQTPAYIKGYGRNWIDSFSDLKALRTGNYTDWRMPNLNEIISIIDYSAAQPNIYPGYPFIQGVIGSTLYWTSTSLKCVSQYTCTAWCMRMDTGINGGGSLERSLFYVWPVRSGQGSVAVLVISKSGSGIGSVTSDPTGIDCGADCRASFDMNQTVTLTATAGAGSNFSGWSGECSGTENCTVTMDASKFVAAEFQVNTTTTAPVTTTTTTVHSTTTIMAGSGHVRITTNLARASFVVNAPGGETFNGSGLLWVRRRASLGDYTVTYGDVAGYTTPPPQTKTLHAGETIVFNGTYAVAPTGTVRVTTNLARASFVVSSGTTSRSGTGVSRSWTSVPVGDYTVTYGDVPGYTTPPPQTKTLHSGETIVFNGTYAAAPTTTTTVPPTTTTTVMPTTTTTTVQATTSTIPILTTTSIVPATTIASTTSTSMPVSTTTTVQPTTSTTPILTTTSTVPATTTSSTTSTSMPASTTTTTTTAGPRFVDNNNGTVTDTRTGRIWLKKATRVEEGYKNWNAAVAYCSSLASGTAGLIDNSVAGDWRLPNKAELEGLGTDPPATWDSCPSVWTAPGAPFTDVDVRENFFYWSTDESDPSAVSMFNGCVRNHSQSTDYNNVWPVRK